MANRRPKSDPVPIMYDRAGISKGIRKDKFLSLFCDKDLTLNDVSAVKRKVCKCGMKVTSYRKHNKVCALRVSKVTDRSSLCKGIADHATSAGPKCIDYAKVARKRHQRFDLS